MRKNTARHWLHAALDLLPILVIPIFALQVRSDNGFEPITIEVQQSTSVDFNQIYDPQNQYPSSYGITLTIHENTSIDIQGTLTTAIEYNQYVFSSVNEFKRDGSKYAVLFENNDNFEIGISGYTPYTSSFIWSAEAPSNWFGRIFMRLPANTSVNITNLFVNVVDLTKMYGRGNEPTISEYLSDFPNFYEGVVSSQNILIFDNITYSDTDVGSQTIYTLYRTVDNYFNMGNVFNMSNVYQWFSLNIFNGTIPLSIYVVWNIVLYEFVMDLLFLLYGLFMWFIDMLKRLIEKPIDSIK